MRSENLVLDRVKQTTLQYSLRHLKEDILIQTVHLGDHGKTMGAVSLILNEVLNLNILQRP